MSLPTEGLHDGIDEGAYHADRAALSSTGAKTLLYQGARIFKYQQENPVHRDVFDFGSVVHALILGVGEYQVLDFPDWRSKASQAARENARAEGLAPILAKDYAAAEAMRDAVYANDLAASILSDGRPEVSIYATDPTTGVPMRGRIDWLRTDSFADVKTVGGGIHPADYQRTVWNLHYAFQADYYQRILTLNGLDPLPPVWIAAGKDKPHEVVIYQPDADLMARAHDDVDLALQQYARCVDTDDWPSLTDPTQIHTISAPRWA